MDNYFSQLSNEDKLHEIAQLASFETDYISKAYQRLKMDGILELYIFNCVISWESVKEFSIVSENDENFNSFILSTFEFASEIDSELVVDNFLQLFLDRQNMYLDELSKFLSSRHTGYVHFPGYFFRRLYFHPLKFNEIKRVNSSHEEYFPIECGLEEIYLGQISRVKSSIYEIFC